MKPSLIIAGLGNPGSAYAQTRHNAGFRCLDTLSEAFGQGEWQEKEKFISFTQEARVVAAPVLLVKPMTFMNLSGNALRKAMDFYKLIPSEQLLVISDDVDLPLGEVRFRKSGGPGTHNGLKSVAQEFGDAFPRIRIGLGNAPAGSDLASWVLSVPTAEEEAALKEAMQTVPALITEYVLGKMQ
ncbi:MAG: aminoacyl-tRNA hydrolase [Candidatus Peribacteraceae bacterium]|jgi:PTH1 family peptidyl-tRNA hydrolase